MEEMPDEFWTGVDQFNQQQYYACHDTLEALWIEADQADKGFYQGILQIAVALYHLSNQNWRGAVILMGEGIHRLHSYPPVYGGVNIESFVIQASHLHQWLQQLGAEQVAIALEQLNYGSAAVTSDRTLPTLQKIDDKK
jgi:predicted metal-dependent hydrolase